MEREVGVMIVVIQERFNVFLIEEGSALRTRQNEVKVEEEAHPRVERDPAKDKIEGILHNHKAREHDKVDEPWGKEGRVGGM